MAIIKFSGLVTDIVGKLNGSVFQGSKFGTVLRSNNFGKSAKTVKSFRQRSDFSNLSAYSKTMTSAQKATWESIMPTISRATKGGVSTPYNWWNGFMAFNGKLLMIGSPANLDFSVYAPLDTIGDFSVVVESAPSLHFQITTVNAGADINKLVIRMSPPVGINVKYSSSKMRIAKVFDFDGTDYEISAAEVVALFGTSILTEPRWFDAQIVSGLNGVFSQRMIFQLT